MNRIRPSKTRQWIEGFLSVGLGLVTIAIFTEALGHFLGILN